MATKNGAFPPQKVPLSQKDKEWKENSLLGTISKFYNSEHRRSNMQVNYDMMNSIFDLNDMKYVTDPYQTGEGFPAKIQNINIIRPKIELLKGEETKRPESFVVFRTDEAAVEDATQKQKDMLYDVMEGMITLGEQVSSEEEMKYLQQRLQEIKEYVNNKYYDPAEQTANKTLKYLREKLDIKSEFMKGWEDALVAGEEVYYVGILNGEPVLERVNPINFGYDRDPDMKGIEEGDGAVRYMQMTPTAIHDRFYDLLEEEDLDKILDTIQGRTGNYGGIKGISNGNPIVYRNLMGNSPYTQEPYIDVFHGVWKSFKKIGYLSYVDEQNELQTITVDETYKVQPDEEIEWDWINEWWEGYQIGDDIYIGIKPIEYQDISVDNPNAQKGPYIGGCYNSNNTESKSLVEIMKPLQYMYLILWYRLELTIARDKGKIINMDITQIPKGMGVDESKWMHYLTAMGVNFFNPYDCFAPGTKVIMADGRLKKIEDIALGDKVMGPNGSEREVLHTHNGIDHMYKLKSRTGSNDQIVNSTHKIYYKQKDYFRNLDVEKIATPKELIKEDFDKPYIKNLRYLERVSDVDGSWNKEVLLDPYILGLWLGDGSTGKVDITNIDPEIISYMEGYAEDNGFNLSLSNVHENSEVKNIRLSKFRETKSYTNKPNPFKESLKYYNVLYNKHIPEDFIYTTRENRLKLLAGLIDTDGYYSKRDNYYVFSQSEDRKHIVEDAAFIARSLGFKCTVNKYDGIKEKFICNNKNISVCQPTYVLTILEGDFDIPVNIERKKSQFSKIEKRGDKNLSKFTVEYNGIGDFYGIAIDGDNLFLLEDFTIVHNSGWDIPGREGGKGSAFNQFSQVDLTMSNVIAEYINLLTKVEEMIGELSGVSRQRQGSISTNELVGNVERSVIQSSHITEPLFWKHNNIKRNALSALLNVAKFAWRMHDKKKVNFILNGPERVFLQITDDFLYSDYDVFLSDATKEHRDIEKLEQLYQPAMQNGATLLDIASIMTANNMSEIKVKLSEIEQKRIEMQQQQVEAEQALQLQSTQMIAEQNRITEEDSIRRAETAITVAMLKNQSGNTKTESGEDIEDNSPSMVELTKLDLEKQKIRHDYELKAKQIRETERHNREVEIISKKKKVTPSK